MLLAHMRLSDLELRDHGPGAHVAKFFSRRVAGFFVGFQGGVLFLLVVFFFWRGDLKPLVEGKGMLYDTKPPI